MSSLRAYLLLCLFSLACVGSEATPAVPAPAAPARVAVVSTVPDLRETLATTTQERDHLLGEIERLDHQRSLLLVVMALLVGAVGWLARTVLLADKRTPLAAKSTLDESELFPDLPAEVIAATTVTIRKNATITIRNGSTQREEVSE
ncbi:MAG TPA: hypothetical protein VHX44_00390 [Planctomycetota bacterium]|nr:hypothetical protein [Planctomycetota bacterium]